MGKSRYVHSSYVPDKSHVYALLAWSCDLSKTNLMTIEKAQSEVCWSKCLPGANISDVVSGSSRLLNTNGDAGGSDHGQIRDMVR